MRIRVAEKEDRAAVFALRFEVFVKEQNVPPELELDGEDDIALHIMAEENGAVVGCARVILSENDAHIGRLAVKKAYRGKGVGSEICRFILDLCRARGIAHIWLGAQLHAVGFYEKLGFLPRGGIFMDAGIEHIKMEISVQSEIGNSEV